MNIFVLFCAACVLSEAFAGVVPRTSNAGLSRFEADIAEWIRRGYPTVVEFPIGENKTALANLIALPPEPFSLQRDSTDYQKHVRLWLFTRENPNGTQFTADKDGLLAAGYRSNRTTKVVVHGFGNTIKSDLFKTLRKAFIAGGDFNVIGVDWGDLTEVPWYVTARNHVEGVGKYVAGVLNSFVEAELLQLKDLHLLGHSLGAHVVGNCGRNLKGGKAARLTGMDAALPLFLVETAGKLDKNDAELVDVIHTCGGLLGFETALGHVDFFPNGGSRPQPGCGLDLLGSCSHSRSWQLFAESVVEDSSFQSMLCASESDARSGNCPAGNSVAFMGFDLYYTEPGSYYLMTADFFPFDERAHAALAS